MKVRYFNRTDQVPHIRSELVPNMHRVGKRFAFRANDYYLDLINWEDPDDPIRRIIMPDDAELDNWGQLDASNEAVYTVAPGLEHKYPDTAIFLLNNVCGGYCRFCFRKRLFMEENEERMVKIEPGLAYLRKHPEITNLLITGGDPLILSTPKLSRVISAARMIQHISIIRIGTKMPAFNPYRILDDASLPELIARYSMPSRRIYFMVHFNHPNELTEPAVRALKVLMAAGAIVANQTPLLRGVNDDPDTLAELFRKLSFIGVPPYYIFICRPTLGNKDFAIPLVQAYKIVERAKMRVSGLARRARLVMSHATGKIEIVGLTQTQIFLRYHRAANPEDESRFMVFRNNPFAYWLDDLKMAVAQYAVGRHHSVAHKADLVFAR